jgi:hypothetical protein
MVNDNKKKEVLEMVLQLDGPKKKFVVALIQLMVAHKECFPEIDADWDAVCRLLIPESENNAAPNT